MDKIKISVVSYLNSKPFIYGLENNSIIEKIDLQLDIPSVCAQKLMDGKVDIGLVPIAIIPQLNPHYIISDYCIGATGKVASVMLYSDVPLHEIKSILLDYQSRTSVTLVKILAAKFWKINPDWIPAAADYEKSISDTTAGVIIGDRTFGMEKTHKYVYDLAEEWVKFSGLPFVFACWVSNKQLPDLFLNDFNNALKVGLDARPQLISDITKTGKYPTNVGKYLTESLSYEFDTAKKQGLELFLELLEKPNQ